MRLIRLIRIYPVVVICLLALVYLLGGFSNQSDQLVPKSALITLLYIFASVVPLLFIIGFIYIGAAGNKVAKQSSNSKSFNYQSVFDLPNEQMSGYKLALITGRNPILTGLTGDTYLADASASCSKDVNHVPPVVDCECGFYAYRDLDEAAFELTINPGSFLLAVDLYGVGFKYDRGYRAESQVVRGLKKPSRCQHCRILPGKVFVANYRMGYDDSTWWQWQFRCLVCSNSHKAQDKLSITQMEKALTVVIT
ncbi:MAG: hypothetical protein FJW82_04570 [Actinobacteria bacterium]|nr:hypothetical protein [Actinomycetota bacterium]